MRILTAICLLLTNSAFAEPIPARDPFFGEPRPSWWWDIWGGCVVVLEGKITFRKYDEPDIRIQFNKERMKDMIPDDKTCKLQSKLCDYYVGELEILKFHYADGGAMSLNENLLQMKTGGLKRIKVLIPTIRIGDNTTLNGMDLQPDNEIIGIHLFDYSNLILGLSLVYKEDIPKENLRDAQEVFKLREKHEHAGVNRVWPPNIGCAGFQFQVNGGAVVIEKVIPGTPASKIGLRTGDVILSINGEKIADPDLGAVTKLCTMMSKWRVGDQIEIEVQRGKDRPKLRLELISEADIRKLINSEQAGADQPATKPADKLPVENQPSTPTSKDLPR